MAFTGAAKDEDVEKERITIPELIGDIETQTDGILKKSNFYPVPCVLPFSDLVEAYTGRPQVRFTAHEHCGAATYVFVTKDGMVPVTRMVDVESLFAAIEQMANKLRKVVPSTSMPPCSKVLRSSMPRSRKARRGAPRSSGN